MADPDHLERLKASIREHNACEKWNQWVKGNPFVDIDLQGADLQGLSLLGVDLSRGLLSEANFTNADLRGALFRGADLEGCHLKNAKLRWVDFSYAYLVGYDRPEFEELRWEELLQCKNLKEVRGLSDEFMDLLSQKNPQLMQWWILAQGR